MGSYSEKYLFCGSVGFDCLGFVSVGETQTGSMAAETHHKAEGKEMCGRAAEDAQQVSSGEQLHGNTVLQLIGGIYCNR